MSKKSPELKLNVRMLLRDEFNHILLVQRKPDDKRGLEWELPGGGIESGQDEEIYDEDVYGAAAREAREETPYDDLEPCDFREVCIQGVRQTRRGTPRVTIYLEAEVERRALNFTGKDAAAGLWLRRPDVRFIPLQPQQPKLWTPSLVALGNLAALQLTSDIPHEPQAQGLYYYAQHHWAPAAAEVECAS